MDIRAQLDALVGQSVNLDDQTRPEPEVFTGTLVGQDGYYTVVAGGQELAGFYWHEVLKVSGHGIELEGPAPFNEEWDDSDRDDDDGW